MPSPKRARHLYAEFWLETVKVAARLDVDESKLKPRIRSPCCLEDGAEPAHLATSKNAVTRVHLGGIEHLSEFCFAIARWRRLAAMF